MDDAFKLPVTFGGKELLFPASLLQTGYSHKFQVDVYGTKVMFERDEEGAYRAIVNPDDSPKDLNPDLLQAIAEAIVEVLK
ncbi:MAG TPA: hypothetical protein VM871_09835 [Flavisolibacter sp.]|nr:hypothetical protein [Flavisolibacter sp.]